MEKLGITITKDENGQIGFGHSENADIHELIGLLATTMNHLILQAQGVDVDKLVKEVIKDR